MNTLPFPRTIAIPLVHRLPEIKAAEGFISKASGYYFSDSSMDVLFGASRFMGNPWLEVPHTSLSQAEQELGKFLAVVGLILLSVLALLFAFN